MTPPLEEPIGLEVRLDTKRRLQSKPRIESPGTATLIYDAMVKVADRMSEANKLLEAKANGVIALSSALLGFGAGFANGQRAVHWQLAVAAMTFLLVAILCALRVNFIATSDLPNPGYYNLPSVAADPANEAKITLELAESWHRYTTDERTAWKGKLGWLDRSAVFMSGGILAFAILVVEVIFAGRASAPTPPVVH